MLLRTGSRILGLALVALTVPLVAATPARAGVATGDLTHIHRDGDAIAVSSNADRDPGTSGGAQPFGGRGRAPLTVGRVRAEALRGGGRVDCSAVAVALRGPCAAT